MDDALPIARTAATRVDRLRWAGLALIAIAASAMAALGIGADSEARLRLVRDALQPRAASGKVVIVEIDARSLTAVSTWPWPRSRHGAMAERLRSLGAGTIAFDVDFSAHSSAKEDAAFAASLARVGGDVILPTFVQQWSAQSDRTHENLPIDALREHAFTGSVNVQPDTDGQLRRYSYGIETDGIPRPSIGALLAGGGTGAVGEDFRIDPSIDPATIPRVSAVDLLNGFVERGTVAGKAVVIGATAVEMGDRYLLPGQGILPGVVVQALAAETLIQNTVNPDFGAWPALLLATMIVLIWAVRTGLRYNSLLLIAAAILIVAAPLGFERNGLGSPAIIPALALIVVAGAWSALLRFHRKVRDDRLVDASTRLPNSRALIRSSGNAGHIVVARFQPWTELQAVLSENERTQLVSQIVARLDTAFPGSTIHAIEGGTFGWISAEESADALLDAAEGACALFRPPIAVENRSLLVTPAFGIEHRAVGSAVALTHASVAAAQAADNGQRCRAYSEQAMSRTDRALALLGEIDGAIDAGDIFVFYQPKFDIAKGAVTGAEALVRWRHPVLGAVSPDEFIPLIENSGHIGRLTFAVIDRCFADLRAWDADGLGLGVSINVSARLLDDRPFTEGLFKRLKTLGQRAARVTLEITESAAIGGAASAIAALERVRRLGARISIDDYGTGHATLSYLRSFPTDEIKIDKSFVTAMGSSASDRILVRSTIELAHELGFAVVAEGVEDAACLALLTQFGCDVAQGWEIGRPMPAASLEAMARCAPDRAAA